MAAHKLMLRISEKIKRITIIISKDFNFSIPQIGNLLVISNLFSTMSLSFSENLVLVERLYNLIGHELDVIQLFSAANYLGAFNPALNNFGADLDNTKKCYKGKYEEESIKPL